ncbi:MAG: Fic family protein [Candidatus Cryptobacteroides sp.]
MIEKPPQIDAQKTVKALCDRHEGLSDEYLDLIDRLYEGYEYWDSVKYKRCPEGVSNEELWVQVKISRMLSRIEVWKKYSISFGLTNKMQRMCHEFDMNFGGSWGADSVIPAESKERYLISSLMEEAIYSSMIEGAATTRKVAKEMLRKKISPKDKSQQMIFNNYQTINYIVAHKNDPLTEDLFLQVHRLMTENTLDNPSDSGRFRTNDAVVVEDGITHEVVHIPPACEDIPEFIQTLCDFVNMPDDSAAKFIHPIIKGIIVHFMIAYIHPFVDGNGRTARAMFYWYMVKQGYWLTEYLSVSRVISRSKIKYEKTFLYAEADGLDIGYFIDYNLEILDKAFKELQSYIKRKQQEQMAANAFLHLGDINQRQAQIIQLYYDNPKLMLTVKDVQVKFMITPTTAKTDLIGLVKRSLLSEIHINKVKRGYVKGDGFDEIVNNL